MQSYPEFKWLDKSLEKIIAELRKNRNLIGKIKNLPPQIIILESYTPAGKRNIYRKINLVDTGYNPSRN